MKVAVIGAGVMGQAIARGASSQDPNRWSFTFYDPQGAAAEEAASHTGGRVAGSAAEAVDGADLVLLAVKPQVQGGVLAQMPPLEGATLVSIAAGRPIDLITADVAKSGQTDVPIVRVMPNLNALVGQATTAVCGNTVATQEQVSAVTELFESVGSTFEVDEALFPVFTAMAGSSPAWFFQIVDDLARAGVKHGLTKQQAAEAACSAMLGSATMLVDTMRAGGNAATLVDRVCSPGGTTIAGLLAAQSAGLGDALTKAVDATVARDQELAES